MADNEVVIIADDVAIITAVNGVNNIEVQIEATQTVEYTDNGLFVAITATQVASIAAQISNTGAGLAIVFGG